MPQFSLEIKAVVPDGSGGFDVRYNSGEPPLPDQWTGTVRSYGSQQELEDARLFLQNSENAQFAMLINEWYKLDPNYEDPGMAEGINITV